MYHRADSASRRRIIRGGIDGNARSSADSSERHGQAIALGRRSWLDNVTLTANCNELVMTYRRLVRRWALIRSITGLCCVFPAQIIFSFRRSANNLDGLRQTGYQQLTVTALATAR